MKKLLNMVALVLVFALLLTAAAPPRAYAVIPEGLIILAAITLTMGTCVAITMIAADSAGMTGAIQVAAEKGLQDTAEFTEQLIRGFNQQRGLAFTEFLLLMAKGARITKDGALALGEEVSAWLTDFLNWAWSEDGGNLQASAPSVGDMTVSGSDVSSPPSWFHDFGGVNYSSSGSVTQISNERTFSFSGGQYFCFYHTSESSAVFDLAISDSPFVASGYLNGNQSTVNATRVSIDGFVYYRASMGQFRLDRFSGFSPGVSLVSQNSHVVDSIAYALLGGYGEGEREQADTNVLQLPAEGAVDTNILQIPDQLVLPPVQGSTTADSYLGAVRDAIYTGTGTLDYTDAQDVAGTATLEMTGAATVDQVASGTSSEMEDSTEVAEGVGSPTLDNYSIDLRDFFPFCIPFDIYDMLSLLSSSRAAPHVTWRFYVPGNNGMEVHTLDLDFAVLDPVASVLRTMELLAFAVGLAFATKKLLMGS